MINNTKYRRGFLPLPATKKAKISPAKLRAGLSTLDRIWSRGILPEDLRKHYLFTWFAKKQGRVIQQSNSLGLHRNTLIYLFTQYSKKKPLVLRSLWNKVNESNPLKSFPSLVYIFYKMAGCRPEYSKEESNRLIDLWLVGFPQQLLRVHYFLWAFNKGYIQKEICKRMKVSFRTLHRIRFRYAKKDSPAFRWLSPLKVTKERLFPLGKRGRKPSRAAN